jgi:HK97 family phage major capsid protein
MAFQKIQEYINTDDGTPGTLLIPKLILPQLVEEVERALIPRELAAMVLRGFQGSTISVNLETPGTLNVQVVSEGAEIPLDNLQFSAVTFNPVKYGVSVKITREMMEDSQFDLMQRNIAAVGRRFAENETKLIVLALDGAAATTAGGAAITIANITESMQDLDDGDYTPTDILVGTEVLNDLRNIDTFVEANKVGNTEMLQRGFLGTLYGMNVVKLSGSTTALPSATYRKYAYVIDRTQAYGVAIKRDITVENFDMPTFDMQGAAITQRIDVQLLRSAAVSKITTT